MKKQIIIKTLELSEIGQRIHFQINLPRDAERITGVYHSFILKDANEDNIPRRKDGHFYQQTVIIGDIRLQAFERAGWFYVGNVTTEDLNLTIGDVSIISPLFQPKPATHSVNNFSPESVLVDATKSTVIHGYFFDRVSTEAEIQINYQVKIYLEVELKNCEA